MDDKETFPIKMKVGDKRVLINGKTCLVDFRVISEDLYQRMLKKYIVEKPLLEEQMAMLKLENETLKNRVKVLWQMVNDLQGINDETNNNNRA